jgi:hypothetical protein
MKVTSVFIKYLNCACKITWMEFLITLCLVKNSIQISKRKHSVTSRFIWDNKLMKQLERVSHRDIQTLDNNVWKHSRLFSRIWISPVKHSLSLFIYYINCTFQFKKVRKIQNLGNLYNWGSPFVMSRTDAQNRVEIIFKRTYLNGFGSISCFLLCIFLPFYILYLNTNMENRSFWSSELCRRFIYLRT